MEIIIPRNTKIPFEKTITLKSINDSSFDYKIYEGERKLVKYNKLLGECKLDNISKIKKGKEIEINFSMDINYNLFIKIKEIGTNNENTIKIKYDGNRLEEEIEKLIEEGEEYEENDKKEIEEIKNKLLKL